jgi:hypothetical protein
MEFWRKRKGIFIAIVTWVNETWFATLNESEGWKLKDPKRTGKNQASKLVSINWAKINWWRNPSCLSQWKNQEKC